MNQFISSITKKEKKAIFEYAMEDLKKNPLIEILLKQNRKLEKENRNLQKTIVAICNQFSSSTIATREEGSNTEAAEQEEDEEVAILDENESNGNENIVYTIQDEDSEVKIIKMEPGIVEEEVDNAILKMKEATDELLKTATSAVIYSSESVKTSQQILADIQAISDDEEEEAEEEAQEEEVVEEAEEVVEVEEEEVVEEEVVEAEEEVEEEGVYEIKIKGTTYYVTNEINSIIYAVDKDGDISIEAGIYKNGKPTFYKK